jgi:hypothetical protein
MRRLLSFFALAFSVTFLTATPAFAVAKGTDRPFKGSGLGTGVVELVGGVPVGSTVDGALSASHLGSGTFHVVDVFSGPTTGSTTATFVAANGDTVTMSGPLTFALVNPTTYTFTIALTITSGTGRFAGASGTETATGTTTSSLTFQASFTFTGTISY